jgi:hypothetical protein
MGPNPQHLFQPIDSFTPLECCIRIRGLLRLLSPRTESAPKTSNVLSPRLRRGTRRRMRRLPRATVTFFIDLPSVLLSNTTASLTQKSAFMQGVSASGSRSTLGPRAQCQPRQGPRAARMCPWPGPLAEQSGTLSYQVIWSNREVELATWPPTTRLQLTARNPSVS